MEVAFKLTSKITVKTVQHMGGDHMIVAAARVSTSGEEAHDCIKLPVEEQSGLINYLMQHRHGCYDSETEVLTSGGWKRWPDVTGDESFVTLNTTTDEIECQKAERVVHKRVDGPMIRIKMCHVDAMVTPDHNMLAAPRTNDGWKYGLHPAKNLLLRSHRIRLGGGTWEGTLHDPKDAAIAGFVAADGHVGTSIEFRLRRLRKIKWLSDKASVTVTGDRYRLQSPSLQLRRWCESTYTASKDRCLPREILENGDAETIQAMLDGYLTGDGSVSATGKVSCSTVSRQMVSDIQEAALKCGLSAVETSPDIVRTGAFGDRPLYRMTIYSKRNSEPRIGWTDATRREEVQVVDYHGDVHCVTVPNGTLYVRRNGKPMWCGNTPFEHSAITFFVHAPIFVWREWHRHRIGFSYNEESARYKTLEPVFYAAPLDRPVLKVGGWKPGRPKFLVDAALVQRVNERNEKVYRFAYEQYLENLKDLADPGFARDCLPVGIYSSCWVTCNPRSLMSFLSLRTHHPEAVQVSYPLYEIEEAARTCEEMLAHGWPLTYTAFNKHGRVAP